MKRVQLKHGSEKQDRKTTQDVGIMQMARVMGNQAVMQCRDNEVLQLRRVINLSSEDTILADSERKINTHYRNLTHRGVVGIREDIIIICHGENPLKTGHYWVNGSKRFTPTTLAWRIHNIIPDRYNGEIFVNGCYTSTYYMGANFVNNFNKALRRIKNQKNHLYFGHVRGNDGEATTTSSGRESVKPLRYGLDYNVKW